MKPMLLALAFLGFSVYVLFTQRQTTLNEFILEHNCSTEPVKTDPVGHKYREYYCADGIGHVGPYYEPVR